jgi:hypothetical protein
LGRNDDKCILENDYMSLIGTLAGPCQPAGRRVAQYSLFLVVPGDERGFALRDTTVIGRCHLLSFSLNVCEISRGPEWPGYEFRDAEMR